jgi:hypothetical protein
MINCTRLRYLFHYSKEASPIRAASREYIFIHLIKTAGTSVGNALDLESKLHLPAKEIIRRVGRDKWETCYKFAFVRNPWDKVVSQYKYNIKMNHSKMKDCPISFEKWLYSSLGDKKDIAYYDRPLHFASQLDWILDDREEVSVNHIGKFENLVEDFNIIRKELGIIKHLPFLNSSKALGNKPYQDYYTNEMAQLVAEKCKKDIDYFGYSF